MHQLHTRSLRAARRPSVPPKTEMTSLQKMASAGALDRFGLLPI